ncbi:MAG: phosphatase PAP2 family protein [Brachymonas sp.]|nr:phosphatase PAP2 family protein [Brachymonas sp.]
MHPAHSRKTLEMVELALGFSSIICMRFKAAMAVARPVDMSTEIQPIIATPSHSSFPSGHATEAFMIAYTLPYIVSTDPATQAFYKDQLMKQAERIAVNRTVAGVHFPIDSYAGQLLAKALASYFLHAAGIPNTGITTHLVNSDLFGGQDEDFNMVITDQQNEPANQVIAIQQQPLAPLAWIAQQASGEWV